jgi:tetratricopeptide (TPR) repeat protein
LNRLLPLLFLSVGCALASGSAADLLFERGLYADAATEYQRNLFLGSKNPAIDQLKLGLSLGAAHEVDRAADALRTAAERYPEQTDAAGRALAGLFTDRADIDRARLELMDLLIFTRNSVRRARLNADLGWLELQQDNYAGARKDYLKAGMTRTAAALDHIDRLPHRSPTTAMVLSSFVPGTGEIYSGRVGSGLLSLLVTGASAAGVYYATRSDDWVTAAVVFSVLFLRFYNGSRQNAADYAEQFNRTHRRDYVAGLDILHGIEPNWFEEAELLTGLRFPRSTLRASPRETESGQ